MSCTEDNNTKYLADAIYITGAFTPGISGGTITTRNSNGSASYAGTITFSGGTGDPQTIPSFPYWNLVVINQNSASGAAVNVPITVQNNLTVSLGSVSSYLYITNPGSVTVTGTTSINYLGYIIGGTTNPSQNVLTCNDAFIATGSQAIVQYCTINCNSSFNNSSTFRHGYSSQAAILNLYGVSNINTGSFQATKASGVSYSTVNYYNSGNTQQVFTTTGVSSDAYVTLNFNDNNLST